MQGEWAEMLLGILMTLGMVPAVREGLGAKLSPKSGCSHTGCHQEGAAAFGHSKMPSCAKGSLPEDNSNSGSWSCAGPILKARGALRLKITWCDLNGSAAFTAGVMKISCSSQPGSA